MEWNGNGNGDGNRNRWGLELELQLDLEVEVKLKLRLKEALTYSSAVRAIRALVGVRGGTKVGTKMEL